MAKMGREATFKKVQLFFSEAKRYMEPKKYGEIESWGGDGDFSGSAPPKKADSKDPSIPDLPCRS